MQLRAVFSISVALAAGGAATSAPTAWAQLPETAIAPALDPAGAGNRWQYDFRGGTALLRTDATVRSYLNTSTPGDAGTAQSTVLDPGATLTPPAYDTSPAFPSGAVPRVGNLTGLRAGLSGDRYWRAGITAVDGRNWSLEEHTRDLGHSIVASDDREAVLREGKLTHARNVTAVTLLATPMGVRGVLADPTYGPEGRGGRIIDGRGRTLVELKELAPKAAVALADGTILVLGQTRYGRSFARVTRAGRVTYPRIVRPKAVQVGSPLQTQAGLYVGALDTSTDVQSIARLSSRGVLGTLHPVERMGIAWPAGCAGAGARRRLDGTSVGPSGTILLEFDCYPADYSGSSGALIELTADLRFARVVATTTPESFIGSGTLPDGRVYVIRGDHSMGAVTLPDALPIARGELGAVTPRGTDEAIVRVRCARPWGAICNGRVEVRGPDGTLFGWAPYALPGRPGSLRAEADLTVQRTAPAAAFPAGLPATARATLLTLPAAFERGSATPPLTGAAATPASRP